MRNRCTAVHFSAGRQRGACWLLFPQQGNREKGAPPNCSAQRAHSYPQYLFLKPLLRLYSKKRGIKKRYPRDNAITAFMKQDRFKKRFSSFWDL